MIYKEHRRIGKDGPVVVTYVDDALNRRTIAVPFARSGDVEVEELMAIVAQHVVLIPPNLDDGKGV